MGLEKWLKQANEAEQEQGGTPMWKSVRNGAIAGGLFGGMLTHRAKRLFPVPGWKRALGGLAGGGAAGAGLGAFLHRWYQRPAPNEVPDRLPYADLNWPTTSIPLATLARNHYAGAQVPLGNAQLFVPQLVPAPTRDYHDLKFRDIKHHKPHESIRPEFTLEAIDPNPR